MMSPVMRKMTVVATQACHVAQAQAQAGGLEETQAGGNHVSAPWPMPRACRCRISFPHTTDHNLVVNTDVQGGGRARSGCRVSTAPSTGLRGCAARHTRSGWGWRDRHEEGLYGGEGAPGTARRRGCRAQSARPDPARGRSGCRALRAPVFQRSWLKALLTAAADGTVLCCCMRAQNSSKDWSMTLFGDNMKLGLWRPIPTSQCESRTARPPRSGGSEPPGAGGGAGCSGPHHDRQHARHAQVVLADLQHRSTASWPMARAVRTL